MTNETQKPHKIHLGRGIAANIWTNETPKGVMRTVTLDYPRYQDKNGEWQNSNSFSGYQVLLAAKALEIAFEYITKLEAETHQDDS